MTLEPYFLYKNLFIRSLIYSEINTFRLSNFSKISFAFNIFVPIPVQEMVYLKAIQKITPMDVSVSGTINQKTYLKKFKGNFSPLDPWIRLWWRYISGDRKLVMIVALLISGKFSWRSSSTVFIILDSLQPMFKTFEASTALGSIVRFFGRGICLSILKFYSNKLSWINRGSFLASLVLLD